MNASENCVCSIPYAVILVLYQHLWVIIYYLKIVIKTQNRSSNGLFKFCKLYIETRIGVVSEKVAIRPDLVALIDELKEIDPHDLVKPDTFFMTGNDMRGYAVSYTHLTLPTNREV